MSEKSEKRSGFFGALRRSAQPGAAALEQVDEPVEAARQPPVADVETAEQPDAKKGWFQRLKAGLTKTSARLSQDIAGIFTKRKLDADTLAELEDLLIQADLGIDTAMRITTALAKGRHNKEISAEEVRAVLAYEVEQALGARGQALANRG